MTQLGLDDSSYYWGNKLSVARHEEGEAIASYGNALHARRLVRQTDKQTNKQTNTTIHSSTIIGPL